MRFPAVALLALAACGGPDLETACQNLIDAGNACIAQSSGSTTTGAVLLDEASYCAVYEGLKGSAAADAADALQCQADAYDDADCSTDDGYAAAVSGALACAGAR